MPESPQTTQLRIVREQLASEERKQQLELLVKVVGDFKDIVIEVIRTATTNPLMGAVLGLVLSSVLTKLGVIDSNTGILIDTIITAAYTIDMATDVITAITSITHIAGSTVPPQLVQPSAQVVVFEGSSRREGIPSGDLAAALASRIPALSSGG